MLAVILLVLGGAFAGSAAVVSTNVLFEQDVNRVVGEVVEEPRYDDLAVVAVSSEFRVPALSGAGRQQVTVTLTRPAGRRYPALSRSIAERVAADTGREVTVVVAFVDQQRYPPGGD